MRVIKSKYLINSVCKNRGALTVTLVKIFACSSEPEKHKLRDGKFPAHCLDLLYPAATHILPSLETNSQRGLPVTSIFITDVCHFTKSMLLTYR